MSRVYRIAVVGAGSGGRLNMAAAAASQRYELAAVCDADPEAAGAAERSHRGVAAFTDHREMFAHVPVDVVCVATWAPSHTGIALDALQLPLSGLVVEKPLAGRYEEARELVHRVQEVRLPLAVPHGLLVAFHSLAILDLVRAGGIGDLKLVEVQSDQWDIINAGIHWVNYFVALTSPDPIRYVMAQCDVRTRTYRDGFQVETSAATYIETAAGVRMIMATGDEVHVNEPGKGTLFRLVGTRGIIEFWGWESAYRIMSPRQPEPELVQVDPGPESRHQRHLEMLADQMDRRRPDYAVAESSLAALEAVEAAYLSCRLGCRVELPLARFRPPERADWTPGEPYSGTGGGRNGRAL